MYSVVEKCIYCGASSYSEDEPARKLGDEHIVAYSLGGRLVLPNASCGKCEDVTKKIEAHVTRGMLGPARTQLGVRTRRKKNRPTHYRVGIETPLGTIDQEIPVAEFPGMILTYYFQYPPGILFGQKHTEPFVGGVTIAMLPGFEEKLLRLPGKKFKWNVAADASIMARLLAKTAHAYVVAQYGFGKFKAFLPDLILTPEHPHLAYYIGGEIGKPPPHGADFYEISCEEVTVDNRRLIVVRLRFFANRDGMPTYLIVAGEIPDTIPTSASLAPIVL